MGSIIIKGMEMPKNCAECKMWSICECLKEYEDYESILYAVDDGDLVRADDCPLVEITSQGRLVDVDAHILEIRKRYCEDCSLRKGIKNGKMKFLYEIGGVVCRACEIEDMLDALDDTPTVIEAEGSET